TAGVEGMQVEIVARPRQRRADQRRRRGQHDVPHLLAPVLLLRRRRRVVLLLLALLRSYGVSGAGVSGANRYESEREPEQGDETQATPATGGKGENPHLHCLLGRESRAPSALADSGSVAGHVLRAIGKKPQEARGFSVRRGRSRISSRA